MRIESYCVLDLSITECGIPRLWDYTNQHNQNKQNNKSPTKSITNIFFYINVSFFEATISIVVIFKRIV